MILDGTGEDNDNILPMILVMVIILIMILLKVIKMVLLRVVVMLLVIIINALGIDCLSGATRACFLLIFLLLLCCHMSYRTNNLFSN